MDTSTLRHLLESLSWTAFSEYCYDFFSVTPNCDETDEAYDISNDIGGPAIEERLYQGDYWQHSGFIIHPLPIDLLQDGHDRLLMDPVLKKKIDSYIQRSERRRDSWDWVAMCGEYGLDRLAIVTNVSGFDREVYEESILSSLSQYFDEKDYPAEALIGCIDSFIENNPEGAVKAFSSFINQYSGDISIHLDLAQISVRRVIQERYLSSGIIGDRTLCAPVIVNGQSTYDTILAEFEHLLNSDPSEEHLEAFLTKHFRHIFGFQYDQIETQLWLRFPELDISETDRRLDIFLRNCVDNDWELLELKKPVALTRTYRGVPVFKAEIYNAIQQIKNYRDILLQHNVKEHFKSLGIEYFQPSLQLVVGRSPDMPTEQWRWLKKNFDSEIKLSTYDELLKEMRMRLLHAKHLFP